MRLQTSSTALNIIEDERGAIYTYVSSVWRTLKQHFFRKSWLVWPQDQDITSMIHWLSH